MSASWIMRCQGPPGAQGSRPRCQLQEPAPPQNSKQSWRRWKLRGRFMAWGDSKSQSDLGLTDWTALILETSFWKYMQLLLVVAHPYQFPMKCILWLPLSTLPGTSKVGKSPGIMDNSIKIATCSFLHVFLGTCRVQNRRQNSCASSFLV